MAKVNQRGNVYQVFAVLLFLVVCMAVGIFWQTSRKAAARTEAERADIAAKGDAAAAKRTEEMKAATELKALQQQIEASKSKDVLQTSLKAADDIYAKWKDGKQVADLTGRGVLAMPVAALQAIRREAEAMIVPDCLKIGKVNLLDAMKLEIDGFMAFMGDVKYGELTALPKFVESAKLLKDFEAYRSMCPSSEKS